MPESDLSFGDESELAAIIRKFIGADTYERVIARTPQFERTDGVEVRLRPKSAEHIDKIKRLPHDVLQRIGVGVWSGGVDWKHYLFPGEWFDCIPEGYPILSIFGDERKFRKASTSADIRYGCLAYGWVTGDLDSWKRERDNDLPI